MNVASRLIVTASLAATGVLLAGTAASGGATTGPAPARATVMASDAIGWPGDDSGPADVVVGADAPIGWPGDDTLTS